MTAASTVPLVEAPAEAASGRRKGKRGLGVFGWCCAVWLIVVSLGAILAPWLPLDDPRVKDVIAAAEAELAGNGRLVIRPSGTEPVIRVMAEGDDKGQVETVVDRICDAVREAAA